MTTVPPSSRYDMVDQVGQFMRKVDTAFKSSDEPPEELPNPDVHPEVNTIFSDEDPGPFNMSTEVGTIWVETDNNDFMRWWDGFGWQTYIGDDWHGYTGLDAWGPAMVTRGVVAGIRIYLVNSAPSSPQPFWIYKLISTGATFYRNPANTAWVQITDQNILDAVESALITPPVDLSDTFLSAIWQAIAPTGKNSTSHRGDLWFESDRDFAAWVWTGTEWESYSGLPPEEPDTGGDGNPPDESPTPSVLAGFGSYFITWDAIDNEDFVEYDVYMSKVNPVVGSPANFLATTPGTFAYCGAEPDGTPLDDQATYYFAIQAKDVDGLAPIGPTVSGGTVRQKITSTQITDDAILSPLIAANQVIAEHVFTNAIYAGALQSDSVIAIKIKATEVTGTKLSGDAIDGKVITGATLRTAASGQRIIARNDGSGGIIEFFTGLSGETPGKIDPGINGTNQPEMILQSPITGTNNQALRMRLRSLNGTSLLTIDSVNSAGTQINDDAQVLIDGIMTVDVSVNSDRGNFTTAMHAGNVYADNEAGIGFQPAQLASDGRLDRNTSSLRYKEAIEPMTLDQAKEILKIDGYTFERNDDSADIRYPGTIAEYVKEAGVSDLWLTYDKDGEVQGFRYMELPIPLIMLVRDLYRRIEELEAQ